MSKSAQKMTERPYHHGDLRQSLIEAACRYLNESGADTLSLRALAREVGVSQTAPYRHFDSKHALFAAVATYGFELLLIELERVSRQSGDDIEQTILALGAVYIEWARQNPEKYKLFFDTSLVEFSEHDELVLAGTKAFNVLLAVIERGIERGVLVDRPVLELAGAFWASIHGAASLLLTMSASAYDGNLSPATQVMAKLNEDTGPTLALFLNAMKKPS